MDEAKRAWEEVGEGFAKLGRTISERYRNLDTRGGSDPIPADQGVGETIRRATDEADRAFTALGDTLRDRTAQEHLRRTGAKVSHALTLTFTSVAEELRRMLGNDRPPSG